VKKKLAIFGIIAFVALVYLLFSILTAGTPYMLSISELTDGGMRYVGRPVRVQGYVVQDTIDWNSRDYTLVFVLEESDKRVTVFYSGEKQDAAMFIGGIRITVAGTYQGRGIFYADTLTMQ
jgi:cytochrome c-type biogenesis protein CcmE